ncbi:hypothetical protein F5146DRAFT_271938 [Armillaria mellea]|nr:hypothetical protein F5146DRAFT_271938 [Armillaria mellea]
MYLAMWWRRLLSHRALSSALLALRLKGLEHLPGRPVIKLTLTGVSRYPDNHSYPYDLQVLWCSKIWGVANRQARTTQNH